MVKIAKNKHNCQPHKYQDDTYGSGVRVMNQSNPEPATPPTPSPQVPTAATPDPPAQPQPGVPTMHLLETDIRALTRKPGDYRCTVCGKLED